MDVAKLAGPAHSIVLKKAEGKTKQEVSQETGIKEERAARILENLQEENLVRPEVEEGRRIFRVEGVETRLEDLRDELKRKLIGGTRKVVEEGEFREAKDYLLQSASDNDIEVKKTVTELEAAYRLENL